jgi:hypothetical protein
MGFATLQSIQSVSALPDRPRLLLARLRPSLKKIRDGSKSMSLHGLALKGLKSMLCAMSGSVVYEVHDS